ncbi:hypothetical protein G1K75_12620 [Tenacibaculum finnmarkense]|uniref:type VI secretion system tube protein TssD n=1 Tax=Tenacibaculum finnmarkense TaxID=2781243 RepID=UPI00187BB3EC|nr:type VI secretion system tube protein TssD [Tenacibaculum finnmarkense]MBE7635072.1 hypothetical protein [Tenacibaculum finnmarkense genomovar ulcerans]MCD8403903.1 hypothetical protein [Tenacibaculum finnmarkense genomovar finnmarkense]MCD8411119.1 hypothetical protein [Tenacibaculum finnmarkense genomovar ulcerans]MCD8430972.1 hypothetical protein [Tenacibaculum finnmarkense genomovar ulcerans]MCD8433488.1 hypothetical protein [Tenacibaculum finnmarkense genomovar ulcerans]
MTLAKLFILGKEIELLWTDINYHREIRMNGKPSTHVIGGLITLCFATDRDTDIILRWMTKENEDNTWQEVDKMEKGKICFYENGFDYPPTKTYQFNDAHLIYFKETFSTYGEEPMKTIITISPAIQNYGTEFPKRWNVSWIPPNERTPYKPIENQEKEQYLVEKIEIENLDEGSENGGANKKLGIIYGKEYRLKVTKYQNNKLPSDNKIVKWSYSYINAEGIVTIGNIKQTGGIITFKTDDLDYCGNKITFYAYIENKENEASLEVFHHYRFRWFDRSKVITQIENRKNAPWKISQGSSSLCGMVALYYVLLKKDAEAYIKLAKEVHRKGTATINGYTVEPHPKAFEMYDIKPTQNPGYINMGMTEIDWIVLAVTRSKESLNSAFVYKGVEDGDMDMLKAVNWPRMMERMTKQLVGGTNIDSTGLNEILIQQKKRPLGGKLYDYFSNSDLEHIQKIDRKHKEGKHIMMMIDAQMLEDVVSYSYSDIGYESHWVVYEGGLIFYDKDNNTTTDLDEAESLGFKVYTWGYNPVDYKDEKRNSPSSIYKFLINKKLSVKSFKSTFYGYIENN